MTDYRPDRQRFQNISDTDVFPKSDPHLGKIAFTEQPVRETGVVSFLSWASIAEILGPETPRDRITGFTISARGITIHKETR